MRFCKIIMQQNINMGYKIIYTILFVLSFSFLKAQTGIGTTSPNASAKLEVASSTQGFLPPRIALTGTNDNTTIKNAAGTSITPAIGLLVYNTASAGTAPNNVIPGYYYYNGSAWVQIANGLIFESKTAGFTLSAADNNKIILITSASAVTVTVSSVSPNILPIGFSCQFIQGGVGTITLAGSSVTLNSSNGLTTRATNSVVGLVMNTTNTGFVFGDSIF
jgi:hypothetical protein